MEELPDTYVIFICDFDPIGLRKYRYTLRKTLKEDGSYEYVDGVHTIFLSTMGENDEEVPMELVKFLKFVKANLAESTNDFNDDFVTQLQSSVAKIKADREMGKRYMTIEEMMKDKYKAGVLNGKQQAVLQLLELKYAISASLQEEIESITDISVLEQLLERVVVCNSLEEFETEMRCLLSTK